MMPWEVDDDLKSLTPMEVRDVVLDELTKKEKAKLNELCIEEMQQELMKKTTSENELVSWDKQTLGAYPLRAKRVGR